MSKKPVIESLVDDIYALISNPKGFATDHVKAFGEALAERLAHRLSEQRGGGTLRASNLGKPCDRQLWFNIHRSSDAEPLQPAARLKFLFGDVLEELLLFLARAAGHDVRHEQKQVDINGVKGHIDAIVDGRLVDCKSAAPGRAFDKFKDHTLPDDDAFGYIDQLGAYLYGSRDNPDLTERDVASFLVIDKSGGHLCLDTYPAPEKDYPKMVDEKREMLAKSEPPERPYQDKAFQASGNRQIPTVPCGYCQFKNLCWADANGGRGLEVAYYAKGPVFLTKVVRKPNVKTKDTF